MKRAILFFVLGFGFAAYYFTGNITLNRIGDEKQPFNVDSIIKGITEISSEMIGGIKTIDIPKDEVQKIGQDVISSLNGVNEQEMTAIINELIGKVEGSLTPEQLTQLQDFITEYYKDKALDEYKNASGQLYFE